MRSALPACAVLIATLFCTASTVAAEKNERPTKGASTAALPRVQVGEPRFIGGQVELVTEMLAKTRGKVARCVADHGGLKAKNGAIKVQFLVRVRGRAEGVEILSVKGVDKTAGRCVGKLLKNRWIGTPSDDPVGVTFSYDLSQARSKPKPRPSAPKRVTRKRR